MKKIILVFLSLFGFLSFENVYASSYEKYKIGDMIKYDPVTDELCQTGDTCYTWYAIKESGYADKNLTIILDHNLGEKTPIVSDATNAFSEQLVPDAANNYLKNLTSSWKYKGRLITGQEVMNILGVTSVTTTISIENYKWLASNDNSSNYWVDAIHGGYSWTINDKTVFPNAYIAYNGALIECYVRPVVDIEKKIVTNKQVNSNNEYIYISGSPSVVDKLNKIEVKEYSKDSDVYKRISNIFADKNKLFVYNFNLYDESNKLVEPDSKIKVNIKLPENLNKDKLKLWYITEDYSRQELSYIVKDNILSFETDHFSIYALTEDEDSEVVKVEDTAFSITKLGITIGLVILVLGIMVIIQTILKEKKEIN